MNRIFREDQLIMRDTVRDFCQSNFSYGDLLKNPPHKPKETQESHWSKIQELELERFFAGDGEGQICELALISFEHGYQLLPEHFSNVLLAKLSVERLLNLAGDSDYQGRGVFIEADFIKTALDQTTTVFESDLVAAAPNLKWLIALAAKEVFLITLDNIETKPIETVDITLPFYKLKAACWGCRVIDQKTASQLRALFYLIKAAEIAGCLAKGVELSVEYAKTREQFGSAIGSFQAVSQKLADIYLISESLRALVDFAAWSADNDPPQLELAAYSALIYAQENARSVIEKGIQLHGGIGFTWEHPLHLYLRRIISLSAQHRLTEEQRAAWSSSVGSFISLKSP
ncbi:MAG TPA: acyl-CoA dehydrogenase family protein [Oligoflexia bacterium]|nr:acyl-CoA dehydrogenase family protein [Oligoflexia bacterium]HMP26451.1 acyl-CoA dehydrogenase family protein [Oligoflexia bacterium]